LDYAISTSSTAVFTTPPDWPDSSETWLLAEKAREIVKSRQWQRLVDLAKLRCA